MNGHATNETSYTPTRTHTCTRAFSRSSLLRLGYRIPGRRGYSEEKKGERKGETKRERERGGSSGYYRQTLIWPWSGLPSNFRALTRPLTRLSVNAPKRRDAYIRRPRFPTWQRLVRVSRDRRDLCARALVRGLVSNLGIVYFDKFAVNLPVANISTRPVITHYTCHIIRCPKTEGSNSEITGVDVFISLRSLGVLDHETGC